MNRKTIIWVLLIFLILIVPMAAWASGTISGTVTEQTTSNPISGVTIRLLDSGSTLVQTTTTDASGLYSLASVTAGSGYQVQARSGVSYEHANITGVTVTDGNTTTVNIAMAPGGQITGTVIDNATSLPIAGVQVMVFDSTWYQYRTVMTNASGVYAVGGLPVRSDFRVAAAGNATYGGQWQSPITVTPGTPVTANFSLVYGGSVSGTVTDNSTGLPVAGITVSPYCDTVFPGWQCGNPAITDAAGQYTIVGLTPVVTTYTIQTTANASYSSMGQSGVSVTAGNTTTVDFALQSMSAGSISGTVTASGTGSPIANLQVNVCFNNSCPGWAQTDASGNYTVTGLAPRTDYQVQVQGDATYAGQTQTGISVTGGNTTTVNFVLVPGGTIAGNVTAAGTGSPIGGLQVSVSDGNWNWYNGAMTDGSGNYTIVGLPARNDYQVQVQGNATYAGQLTSGVTVTAGNTTTVNFSLALGGSVAGTVRDAVSGLGMGSVQVSAFDRGKNNWAYLSGTMTNPDGTYQIDGLPQGSWMIMTNAQGWYPQQFYNGVLDGQKATLVAVVSGSTTTGIDLSLIKGGTISGVVRDSLSNPLAGAEVKVVTPEGNQIAWATADGTGAYMIGPVGPGATTIMAAAPGTTYVGQYYGGAVYQDGATPVSVVTETNTPGIDFSLPAGGILTGTITVDGGAPMGPWLNLYSETDSRWMFNSALEPYMLNPATGSWAMAVPAGTYKLSGSANFGGVDLPSMYFDSTYLFDSATSVVSTGTGTVSNLNFALSSLYGSVTGTVSYGGLKTGTVIEWTSPNPGNDWPKMSAGNGGGLGVYTLLSSAGTWYVKAFMDVNNNGIYDAGEPYGEYAGGSVVVTNGNTVSGVDIMISDGVVAPLNKNILWRDATAGTVAVWMMNGLTNTGYAEVGMAPLNWVIAGTGDFNSDGKTDILWRDTTTGAVAIWAMNGLTNTGYADVGTAPLEWTIAGVGDFNGDGKADILWRNTTTGAVAIWAMNGMTNTGYADVGTAPLDWTIAGVGDFNGDGKADILWRNTTTGAVAIWAMNGMTNTGYADVGTAPLEWAIVGVGDLNGDGKADILWRNTTTGIVAIWAMNGMTNTGYAEVGSAPLNWQVNGIL